MIWLGLAVAHLVNMQLGDESVTGSTVGLLVFDLLMGASLTVGLVQIQRDLNRAPVEHMPRVSS